jgi:1-acyl-sn-glycerol-3-phosphate acyltransferase
MQQWHYHPAADLNRTLFQRLRKFPREPDLLWYTLRSAAALAVRGWLRTYHRLIIHGRENLPAEGSFVMVANHTSHLDALCMLSALSLNRLHQAFPAAAADYFFVSLPGVALSAIVMNALPFHREAHVRQSLRLCQELLAEPGNILIVFPEGTRGSGRTLGTFKPGVGTLLAGTAIPAVPCYLDGAAAALPKGAWLPSPRRISLTMGQPMTFTDRAADKKSATDIAAELRQAVLALQPMDSRAHPQYPARKHGLEGVNTSVDGA